MNRRHFLLATTASITALPASGGEHLPRSVTFIGEDKFRAIAAEAHSRRWSSLPVGERVVMAANRMLGTPYVGFTLEIDDHVESPSVNFRGLDCWTFFEIALGIARMTRKHQVVYQPEDLLREIEHTRYRGGQCNGNYLDRIHYLDEWFRDNHARKTVRDITRELAPVVPLTGRKIDEMTVLWKSYRYLKNNPGLRQGMARIEAELQQHPFHYIPKDAVAAIEPKLQNGDIIGIVTHKPHVYCSHVGLTIRTKDGGAHFMHASATKKRVIIDKSVSGYLADFQSHAGIIVARPV
jgi:hypothetical protein